VSNPAPEKDLDSVFLQQKCMEAMSCDWKEIIKNLRESLENRSPELLTDFFAQTYKEC
jgi:actin-like ATPase involved in cell morphogenesis